MRQEKEPKGRVLALLGLTITVVVLAFFIVRLDWIEFTTAFRGLQAPWIFAVCIGTVLSVSLRALRWSLVCAARGTRLGYFWRATVVGYVGNMVYPARAGEAIRVVALCQTARIGPGHALASAFADRLADVFMLGALSLLTLGSGMFGAQGDQFLVASAVLSTVPILLFVGFVRWGRRIRAVVQAIASILPHAFASRLMHWYEQAIDYTAAFQKGAVLIAALGLTLIAMSIDYIAIWAAIRAMGWSLPPAAAVVVGILIAMGSMIPAAPGYVGIYQVACVLGLSLYGIGEPSALAFSIVLQTVVLTTIGGVGLLVLAYYGRRLQDFRTVEGDLQ